VSGLVANLLLFGRVLRGLGIDADTGRMLDLVEALRHVEIGRKSDFRDALRCLLVRRRDERALFDAAFEAFWRKPSEGATSLDLRALGEQRRLRRPRFSSGPLRGSSEGPEPDPGSLPGVRPILAWSPVERLRHKDFAELSAEELEEVRRLLAGFAWKIRPRRTRRFRRGRGPTADLRLTLRRALRHGGEVLRFSRRRRDTHPRPVVVLADVSGSMERYTRVLLLFMRGLAGASRTEAFVFGTRLTRITRPLLGGDVDEALRHVARTVPDWSGGTRMGEALSAFNRLWARRVLSGGAVVLLISDGWDRGDVALLAEEMARLQRSCHRLVWLNPLLETPDYEPLTRGLQAALPFVDDFLPIHHLSNLEELARHLERLPARRAARSARPPVPDRGLAAGAPDARRPA
jgi:uncharacterized protein with von Willebrand factor type A (vWA) domain